MILQNRAAYLLLISCFLFFACSENRSDQELLAGTWKDENSEMRLKKNGDLKVFWPDLDTSLQGAWMYENSILRYSFSGKAGTSFQDYKLIRVDEDSLVYKSLQDNTVFHAHRIDAINRE